MAKNEQTIIVTPYNFVIWTVHIVNLLKYLFRVYNCYMWDCYLWFIDFDEVTLIEINFKFSYSIKIILRCSFMIEIILWFSYSI